MEDKYYTSSDGTQTLMKDMEYTHLSNGLAKRYRDIFESKNKEEFGKRLAEINDIKDEMHRRINEYYDNIGE